MKRNTLLLMIPTLLVTLLPSCSDSQAKKWSYQKEDMSDFMSLNANLIKNEDKSATFSADTDITLFSDSIDDDDVIVFDVDKVKNELEKQNKDYADYSVLKACSLPVSNIKNLDDKDGFDITFSNAINENYAMLLHSSVTPNNEYVMVNKYVKNSDDSKNPQTVFEENYNSSRFSWEDGGKFTLEIVSNIGMVITGIASDNPAAAMSGVFGLISTVCENMSSDKVSIKDVMNQLKETDKKIDDLSNKIDKNTQLLSDEIVRTEASVDQANMNIQNLAINDFATQSIAKINNFNRNLADEINDYYKTFIKSNQTINLVLSKNKNGEYESLPLSEITSSTTYNFTLNLNDFSNAKKHLENNNNIVQTGFTDELYKDIDKAIASKSDLPEGIKKDNLRDFVFTRIYEKFNKDYFSKNRDKAQEYRNLMIDYSQRISGANGKVSILNSYLSRLEYMYNFASEIKDAIRGICANLLKNLDMNTARASQACLFAEHNLQGLDSDYKTARENIQNFYQNVKKMNDSYSFITSSTLEGGFYRGSYTLTYDNPGNECHLKVTYGCEKLEMDGINISSKKYDMSSTSHLSTTQHARIVTRWSLLKNAGSVSTDYNYLTYLSSAGVIDDKYIKAAEYLVSLKKATNSCYRIITSDSQERELGNGDSNFKMKCIAQGNPKGEYFTVSNDYNYRGYKTSSNWYGKTYEATFMDALTGSNSGKQKISSWARYAESHWYWRQDEYWGFTNDENNYFFSIDIVN